MILKTSLFDTLFLISVSILSNISSSSDQKISSHVF